MLDVDIHNFQSIDHTHIQIEGFTALVGRSNLGKSAIVRALKAALTGAPEEDSVRHGPTCEREVKGTKSCKCYCSVHIKTEGFDLLWEKGGDKNEYVFNGTKYTAVGKGTPSFLESDFGVVKIGDDKILLQVADQFAAEGGGPIFLLDRAGSVVADVLSDVAQLDRINVATKLAERDRRDATAKRKVREKDIIDLKVKIGGFEGLDVVLVRVQEVEADEHLVAEKTARRDRLVYLKDALLASGRQLKNLITLSNVPVPEFEPSLAQHLKYKAIAEYMAATETRQAVIDSLQGVDSLEIPVIEPLHTAWEKTKNLYSWRMRLRTFQEFFVRSKAADSVPTPEMEGVLASSKKTLLLASLAVRHSMLERQMVRMDEAHAASEEQPIAQGIFRIRQLALEETIKRLEQSLEAVDLEHQVIKDDEAALGVCPTCTQPVGLSHVEHAAE